MTLRFGSVGTLVVAVQSPGVGSLPKSASGAPLPREDVSVAAASWGSADPFE